MTKTKLRGYAKEPAASDSLDANPEHLKTVYQQDTHHRVKLSPSFRENNMPCRRTGRQKLTQPSSRARQILVFAAAHGFTQAAKNFSVSRQYVSSMAKRWDVQPPRPAETSQLGCEENKPKECRKKSKRDVVVSFRLKKDELRVLRAILPLSVTQSASSVHKLARAAILQRIEETNSL
jgi:hypothetical protein